MEENITMNWIVLPDK